MHERSRFPTFYPTAFTLNNLKIILHLALPEAESSSIKATEIA